MNKIIKSEDLNNLKTDNIDVLILNVDKNIKIKKTNEIFKNLKSAGFEKIFLNVIEKNVFELIFLHFQLFSP